ncbi:tetratricopeptide repeat protein [Burkholderia seminalis]|uniref:tetratricopeptide repeat protein n=1 Tax=Burkholderia seminalis TaxID=488731 RepID=UPI00190815BB|nr:hypothetical protein [Burkholderia seminalis]MBJ9964512.1 hypothetical protein [Burkholderia seminalis]
MTTDYASQIDKASRAKNLEEARALALQWTHEDGGSPKAWSKLAYVYELKRDFGSAAASIRKALKLAPRNPSYLFKAGVFEYRRATFESASDEFGRCVRVSIELNDGYYLDAAKIAQARCLIALGRSGQVADLLVDVSDDAATWLDGRITAQAVRRMVKNPSTVFRMSGKV